MSDSPKLQLAVIERMIGEEIGAASLPVELRGLWRAGRVQDCLDQLIQKGRRGITLYMLSVAAFWLIPMASLLWASQLPPVLYLAAIAGLMTTLQLTQVFAFFLPRQWRWENLRLQYRIAKE